jgi:[ribosomal protein S18]-alanine N-acetyltransferase
MKAESLQMHIRWGIRRDFPGLLQVEQQCFNNPWTEQDFLAFLRKRQNIVQVAELGDTVVGFIAYTLLRSHYLVERFAVLPNFRLRGIGRQLCEKLTGKKLQNKRSHVRCFVPESNLPAQKFFRALGWPANGVERRHFEDEDAYRFEKRIERETADIDSEQATA